MRQTGDQVHADIGEAMFPERFEIAKNVGSAVQPARIFQILIMKRLHAEADSIHAGRAILLAVCASVERSRDSFRG